MSVKPGNADQYIKNGCGRCEFGGTPQCKVRPWEEELRLLRDIVQESGLTEEIKWHVPCYTYKGRNILLLSALKDCVTISFFHGSQMKDPENILEKPGENSRFARYIRFMNAETILSLKDTILSYIQEAVEIEKSGKRMNTSNDPPLDYPKELTQMFENNPKLEEAFSSLTPGRQRGYLIHFSSAKQAKTTITRIEKCMPKIFSGKGFNER